MQKTQCDISFNEKIRIFSCDYLKCCLHIMGCKEPEYIFTKKLYSNLISTSQLLEDFLDFHGAKNNQNWYFYRELAAAVRHLSLSAYSYTHISNRLAFYALSDTKDFENKGKNVFNFLTDSLAKMAPVILDEARRLKIPMPKTTYDYANFPAIPTSEQLDFDIDDDNKDQHKKYILKIVSEILKIVEDFEEFGFFKSFNLESIQEIIPETINEVEIRRFEMLVHNLQSSFDTYVIHGGYRFGNRKLKKLRGFFSVAFHLLQMTGRMLHFYERHLYEAGYKNIYKDVQNRLASLINPNVLLECVVNYGLYYISHFLTDSKKLAQEVLNKNLEYSSITVGVPVKLGFHCRPSTLVAKIVRHYGGRVHLHVGQDKFDASSVLNIQWAGGKISKENVTEVIFKGDSRTLCDIKILANVNYGENIMGTDIPLPKQLHYLR